MPDVLEIRSAGHSWRMHDPGGRIGRRMAAGRPYEARLLADMRAHIGTQSGSAVDVGAHVGNHSIYLAVVCGLTVHAFEPPPTGSSYPDNIVRLRANLALNGLEDRVVVHPIAAADQQGRARWTGGRYRALIADPDGPVAVAAVDDIIPYVDDVRAVKIDVEGFEPQALAGMTDLLDRNRPPVWTETHHAEAIEAQRQVLEPLNYSWDGFVTEGSKMSRWLPS